MNFKEIISKSFEDFTINSPTEKTDIENLENELNFQLPNDLKEFLLFSDGCDLEMISIFGVNTDETFIDLIEEWKDPEYKEMYPNSQNLFFFASDDMGGFFGYKKEKSNKYDGIYYWDHEEDTVTFVSNNISDFIPNCYQYLE